MARLMIHLPDEVARQVRVEARRAGKSVSAFIADLVKKVAWAREVAKIYGTWVGPFPQLDDPWPDEPETF